MNNVKYNKYFGSTITKMLLSGLFLGLTSSAVMANNYFYSAPPKFDVYNSNFSNFRGLYAGANFVKKYSQYPISINNIYLKDIVTGYDFQDGSLVYGWSSSTDADFLRTEYNMNNVSTSLLLRSGFTFDNSNSSLFQNTLLYGFGGVRVREIESIKSINDLLTRNLVDKVVGVGIEKKIAGFLSLRTEYGFALAKGTCLSLSDWRKGDFKLGAVVRF
ncbi:CLIBASIA_05150 family virulence factor [Candidatus Liberibacter brunswickensis]|uniref:CLIBASIA_05150 family virulence factor n=1 Tax=Candidatus Liberibacter brunswickensis TaxID=1968796 RepID=UPI002FE0984F